ncbi:hypothetical protein ASPCAL04625 [Aspergillus calidoustus]|uniref:Uncharacterized protein n=1 Tax=Aspergillus calidoustus TaxID=454130 RepID=A0A0U5G1Y9_ASPCI|nr:hypothetical protein ASPCAL04625 [Aspergillus calidoustus]
MAQKRRIRELEEDRKILLYLVEALVGALGERGLDAHVRELVCLVRNKAPLEEIRLFVGHASSSSDKSDEETVASDGVAFKAIDCAASDCHARDMSSSNEFLPGSTQMVQESSTCARLSIQNLIDSTEIGEETETFISSIPDLSTSPTPEPNVSRKRVDSRVEDNALASVKGINALMDHPH